MSDHQMNEWVAAINGLEIERAQLKAEIERLQARNGRLRAGLDRIINPVLVEDPVGIAKWVVEVDDMPDPRS